MTPRSFERRMLLVTVLSIVMYAVAAPSLPVLVLGLSGVAFGWFVGRSRGSRAPLPMPAVLGLITIVSSVSLLRALGGEGFTVSLFCEFIMMLLVVKMLDRRKARDDAQVLTLAVFLCIGAILTSNGIGVGLLILVTAPVLISAVLAYQLVAAGEAAGRFPAATAPGRVRRDTRVLVAVTTVCVFAGSTLMFILFPRELGERAFGSWREISGQSQTGFDDEIELGSTGLISESATPVLDLQVLDPTGQSLGGTGRVFYLRGAALTEYAPDRDGRWKWQATRQPSASRMNNGRWARVAAVDDDDPWNIEQRVILREGGADANALFAINEPMFVAFGQPTSWAPNDEAFTFARDVATSIFADVSASKFSYSVRSLDRSVPGAEPLALVTTRREHAEGERPGDYPEEIRAIARRVLESAGIEPDPSRRPVTRDAAAARAIEAFLQTEGGYQYTLSPLPVRPGIDPTVDFLTQTRAGHCEFFASAMAIMCRSVGVEARVITGYVATEFNELTGRYVVRRSNAHAWVEVLVATDLTERASPGSRTRNIEIWRPYDPTPRNDFQALHQKPAPWLVAQIKSAIDALEFAWVSNVVGYSSSSQERTAGVSTIARWARAAEARVSTRVGTRNNRLLLRAAAVGGLVFGSVLAAGWLAGWLASRLRDGTLLGLRVPAWARLRSKRSAGGPPIEFTPDLRAAHEALLALLDRSGPPRPGPVPLGQRLRDAIAAGEVAPAEAEPAGRLARAVYEAAYAGRTPPVEARARLAADTRAVRVGGRTRR